MSLDLERLLCRMIAPNADLRCTATGAMADDYWHRRNGVDMHRMLCSLIIAHSLTTIRAVRKLQYLFIYSFRQRSGQPYCDTAKEGQQGS